jgi:hypothetical protein
MFDIFARVNIYQVVHLINSATRHTGVVLEVECREEMDVNRDRAVSLLLNDAFITTELDDTRLHTNKQTQRDEQMLT